MSHWLFNIYMNGVMMGVKKRVKERGTILKTCGVWYPPEVKLPMFVNDSSMVVYSTEKTKRVSVRIWERL